MKILHTSDWHIGKRLGRHDRMGEFAEVLAEVEAIADERAVGLAQGRPVMAVAGNHDSAGLFEALAPLLRPLGVFLIGDVKRPDQGALLGPDVLGVPAVVAGFPFLREGRVVDFMAEAGEWYRAYAERVAAITRTYNEALVAQAGGDAVPILMAHFMVGGVAIDRGAPRGERELHMGDAYAATAQAIPAGPQYVATGSLLALDFGEAGEQKRVAIVDAEPGQLATLESIPLRKGRPLIRVTDDWDAIEARAPELAEAFLDLTVRTSGTDMTLADRAGEAFPYLVKVRALRPEGERPQHVAKGGRSKDQLYAEYYEREHGEPAPEELLILFRDVLEEAADATA